MREVLVFKEKKLKHGDQINGRSVKLVLSYAKDAEFYSWTTYTVVKNGTITFSVPYSKFPNKIDTILYVDVYTKPKGKLTLFDQKKFRILSDDLYQKEFSKENKDKKPSVLLLTVAILLVLFTGLYLFIY